MRPTVSEAFSDSLRPSRGPREHSREGPLCTYGRWTGHYRRLRHWEPVGSPAMAARDAGERATSDRVRVSGPQCAPELLCHKFRSASVGRSRKLLEDRRRPWRAMTGPWLPSLYGVSTPRCAAGTLPFETKVWRGVNRGATEPQCSPRSRPPTAHARCAGCLVWAPVFCFPAATELMHAIASTDNLHSTSPSTRETTLKLYGIHMTRRTSCPFVVARRGVHGPTAWRHAHGWHMGGRDHLYKRGL